MINKVILVGRLGRSPEFKLSKDGLGICKFTLATDRAYKGVKTTTWHNVVCFGKSADWISEHVGKGSLVYVEGFISVREYNKRDGSKAKATEITAETVKALSSKSKPEAHDVGAADLGYDEPDDDIPF